MNFVVIILKKNKKVLFEIGTEEQSGTTTSDYDLEYTLDQMKNFCNKKITFSLLS